MNTEITGIQIKINGEEKTLSVEEARGLRNALNSLLGDNRITIQYAPPVLTPVQPWQQPSYYYGGTPNPWSSICDAQHYH